MRRPGLWTALLLFLLLLLSFFGVPHPPVVYATPSSGGGIGRTEGGSGGDCERNVFVGNGETPTACQGVVLVWRIGKDLGNNRCLWFPAEYYNCDNGTIVGYPDMPPVGSDEWEEWLQEVSVEKACTLRGSPPCGEVIWNNGLTWSTEGQENSCSRWEWRLSVYAPLPCNRIGISPYPATLVGWPTAFRFLGAGSSGDVASLAYAGSGSPGNPQPGDQRNITLTLQITPAMNAVEMYMPGWGTPIDGGKACPARGVHLLPAGVTTLACWDLPSHPAAGGGDATGNDFPTGVQTKVWTIR